jgi:hypothetical protein
MKLRKEKLAKKKILVEIWRATWRNVCDEGPIRRISSKIVRTRNVAARSKKAWFRRLFRFCPLT